MNCDCITKLERDAAEKLRKDGKFKKPVIQVRLRCVGTQITKEMSLRLRTFNEFEISLEGQKKPVFMNMFHSFCPFCGTKIETDN
jgi:hypothetical protein